jgi:hypothetical protein
MKESFKTSKVVKNELKNTIAVKNRNQVLVLGFIMSTMSEELWLQLKPHTHKYLWHSNAKTKPSNTSSTQTKS